MIVFQIDLQNLLSGWSLKALCMCVAPTKITKTDDGQARIPQMHTCDYCQGLFVPTIDLAHTHTDTSQAFGRKDFIHHLKRDKLGDEL